MCQPRISWFCHQIHGIVLSFSFLSCRKYIVGIDVGKRKCRATIKDRTGQILNDFFFSNDKNSFLAMIRMA
jgi:hypothetical protein